MSKYKCLSVCLILCLIFSGFSAPAEAALPESQAAQRTVCLLYTSFLSSSLSLS